ncbi:MAG: Lrp/AsnC ligand binding domain-containing protein [Candidatus Thorarchaeota archaeon]
MSVTPGEDERIVKELVKDRIVQEAWLTTGEYDALLVIKGEDTEEINHYVNERLRGTEGVIRTVVTFGIQSITQGN